MKIITDSITDEEKEVLLAAVFEVQAAEISRWTNDGESAYVPYFPNGNAWYTLSGASIPSEDKDLKFEIEFINGGTVPLYHVSMFVASRHQRMCSYIRETPKELNTYVHDRWGLNAFTERETA